jgi:signal transduction histidine kinase
MFQNAVEANFSHEQNTPLNSIQNNAEITQGKIEEIVCSKKDGIS